MGIVIVVILVGVLMALLAARKGYNPAFWFLAGGIIGLVILAFLPFVNEKSNLPEDERASKKKTGDTIGGVISGLAVLVLLISLAAR
ncbi:MAG: hypothetical protein ISS78_01195 [Phycisphaerae bacterium]|nr:hypothetical protein [Phycisphaerae bacterium]